MSDHIAPPILFRWTGEVMEPHPRAMKDCDAFYVVGEAYRLVEHQERSQKSHAHYFSAIGEAWQNLPEHLAERFPSSEHLRKWALVKAGFADSRQLVASSKAEAIRLAAFIRPCDEYAVVTVSEAVITVWTPRSQSMKAMGKRDFQASKDAVLSILAGLIGTTVDGLRANAGAAA